MQVHQVNTVGDKHVRHFDADMLLLWSVTWDFVDVIIYRKTTSRNLLKFWIDCVEYAYHLWYVNIVMTSPSIIYVVGFYVVNLYPFDTVDIIWDVIY